MKMVKDCGPHTAACAWTGAVLAKPKAATLPAMARAPVVTRLEMFVIILGGLLLFMRAKWVDYATYYTYNLGQMKCQVNEMKSQAKSPKDFLKTYRYSFFHQVMSKFDILTVRKRTVIPKPHDLGFCFFPLRGSAPAAPVLLCSGLMVATRTDTASPAAKIFLLALISRSW